MQIQSSQEGVKLLVNSVDSVLKKCFFYYNFELAEPSEPWAQLQLHM